MHSPIYMGEYICTSAYLYMYTCVGVLLHMQTTHTGCPYRGDTRPCSPAAHTCTFEHTPAPMPTNALYVSYICLNSSLAYKCTAHLCSCVYVFARVRVHTCSATRAHACRHHRPLAHVYPCTHMLARPYTLTNPQARSRDPSRSGDPQREARCIHVCLQACASPAKGRGLAVALRLPPHPPGQLQGAEGSARGGGRGGSPVLGEDVFGA